MGDFSEKAYEVVRQIPAGKVATYGLVAKLMGRPQSGRYVGFALRNNPSPEADGGSIPCHRVVFKDGSLCKGFAFGGPGVQRELLEAEGVTFADDTHVDLDACLWDGEGFGAADENPTDTFAADTDASGACAPGACAPGACASGGNPPNDCAPNGGKAFHQEPTEPPQDFDWAAELGE